MLQAKHIMLIHRRAAVKTTATGREIVYGFMSNTLSGVPVVNDEMKVIGIVTEFDILGALREGMNIDEITAERIMTKEPVTADMETPVDRLIEMLLENNYTIIPILRSGKLAGVVDRSSVLDAFMESHGLPGFHLFLERI